MQTRDIAHQIIETVSGNFSGAVQIDAIEFLHDLCMIRNLKSRDDRLTKLLQFYILRIILADRHAGIDHVRDLHHDLLHAVSDHCFFFLDLLQLICHGSDLLFDCFRFVSLSFLHQTADLLAHRIALCAQIIHTLLHRTQLTVFDDHFIYQRKFLVLKFLFDVLFDEIRILA